MTTSEAPENAAQVIRGALWHGQGLGGHNNYRAAEDALALLLVRVQEEREAREAAIANGAYNVDRLHERINELKAESDRGVQEAERARDDWRTRAWEKHEAWKHADEALNDMAFNSPQGRSSEWFQRRAARAVLGGGTQQQGQTTDLGGGSAASSGGDSECV